MSTREDLETFANNARIWAIRAHNAAYELTKQGEHSEVAWRHLTEADDANCAAINRLQEARQRIRAECAA